MRIFHKSLVLLCVFFCLHPSSTAPAWARSGKGKWAGVEPLIQEQKYQAALEATLALLKKARQRSDDQLATEALIKATQLEIGLHGYERAIRFLKGEVWPKSDSAKVLLNLYYGHALLRYQEIYGWEISQREKVAGSGSADLRSTELKTWTTEQIGVEISRAFDSAAANGVALDGAVPDFYTQFVSRNTYPAGIRPTLRDAVVYMTVQHLVNQQFWTPRQVNEIYLLKLAELTAMGGKHRIAAADEKEHPLRKAASWLAELARIHAEKKRKEAALEARYVLMETLHSAFTESEDRNALIEKHRAFQRKAERLPWWSRGQALLARMILAGSGPDRKIRARAEAQAGRNASPASVGARECAGILQEIERREYSLSSMASDGPRKRSLLASYRNLTRLYFRAYAEDGEALIRGKNIMAFREVDPRAARALLSSSARAVAAWERELPATRDYSNHRAFISLPALKPGVYSIIASLRPDFADADNSIQALRTVVGELVLSARHDPQGFWEVRALSGETGEAIEGAKISLYRFKWEAQPEEAAVVATDAQGYARFTPPSKFPFVNEGWNYLFVGRHDGQLAMINQNIWFGSEPTENPSASSFIYTDRAIYRPEQKLYFKVVAYSGKRSEGRFQTANEGESLQVRLLDTNRRIVAQADVKLGAFGTGSGEFAIPQGRPLGQWAIEATKYPGSSLVRVEEYKRPTFEAMLKDGDSPLRLNRPAKIKGEARYYFGLPVSAGSVNWRVVRAEVTPWWWVCWGWWDSRPRRDETIAAGIAPLKADGSFELDFMPRADERAAKGKEGVSYDFRVEADVTDEGGETRGATRSFRLGFVSVETRLDAEKGFFETGKEAVVRARLSDLDGKPLRGEASYRIARLVSLSGVLPAELPIASAGPAMGSGAGAYAVPDDSKRARWETSFNWEAITRTWKEDEVLGEGKVAHDEKGEGRIRLGLLAKSGVYRVHYETQDSFGATFRVFRDFVVGGARSEIGLPLLVMAEAAQVKVGGTARVWVHSGLPDQPLTIETYRAGKRVAARALRSGQGSEVSEVLEFPVGSEDRGGFTLLVSGLRDHQALRSEINIEVPWSDRGLQLEFSTFRDQLRPGQRETFRIAVKNDKGGALEPGSAELLSYMYDRSLDLFAPHLAPSIASLYPIRTGVPSALSTLGVISASSLVYSLPGRPALPTLSPDRLNFEERHGIGGPGRRRKFGGFSRFAETDGIMLNAPSVSALSDDNGTAEGANAAVQEAPAGGAAPDGSASVQLRSNFAETAFFLPHLTIDKDGAAAIEFEVPDSVTSWRVMAHALTRDLRGGSLERETKSVKELMVRPYVPRFLREGDEAEIKVAVNNAASGDISGTLSLDIENIDTGKSAAAEFRLKSAKEPFRVAKDGSVTLAFPIQAPRRLGNYAVKVSAAAQGFSDGERRPFPVLPGRMHLARSRFVSLHDKDRKLLEFQELAKGDDPTRENERMVVTVDAQLFQGVLQAIPYLIEYPYECVEQVMNRFLSTGIVSAVFDKYPAVAKMAREFSTRATPLERFDKKDPNRRMGLEETPWLQEAQGGRQDGNGLVKVLDSRAARAEREASIARLRKIQLPSGAFPWFEGGRPDQYMTLYVLLGLSRGLEFQVDVPKELVAKAWKYVRGWLDEELERMMSEDCCAEVITLVNFALSSYPDDSWTGNGFDPAYRKRLLEYSFKNWKKHSPLVKGYLALTLHRMRRPADAKLVWDSVMDSAKNSDELGTYWAREERSWLWYNDRIESHAFALRVQLELDPKNKLNEGLVQWLFLNKKLNHWKSTRATAEVIYSLAKYLDQTARLGAREAVTVRLGGQKTEFDFDPEKYSGKKNQLVVPGEKIGPGYSRIEVIKATPGFAFASATWHFSTDRLPSKESGDFFSVSRRYYKRVQAGEQWQLQPLEEGARIQVGDQLEVQLSLTTKHEAEYVHLRDPRGAGFEPETLASGYKWEHGISWYEETRDSGSNFFFSRLPVGEYLFRYRLRANMAGSFRAGPAEVQSMYAPEFNAYSAGTVLKVGGR